MAVAVIKLSLCSRLRQNFVEVYELKGDQHEFENIATTADPSLLASLKDDLMKLESCSGAACSGA